jgi:hypothetical protein
MTVLDSEPTKSVGHFEGNKFSVDCHQFLLDCCPKLIKTYNFGQNAAKKRQLKNKNEQYCAARLLIFNVAETFQPQLSVFCTVHVKLNITWVSSPITPNIQSLLCSQFSVL